MIMLTVSWRWGKDGGKMGLMQVTTQNGWLREIAARAIVHAVTLVVNKSLA